MICPNCQKNILENETICQNCGTIQSNKIISNAESNSNVGMPQAQGTPTNVGTPQAQGTPTNVGMPQAQGTPTNVGMPQGTPTNIAMPQTTIETKSTSTEQLHMLENTTKNLFSTLISQTKSIIKTVMQKIPIDKKYLKIGIIIIIVLIVIILCISGIKKVMDVDRSPIGKDELLANIVYQEKKNGVPKQIDGRFSEQKITSDEDIFNALEEIKEIMKIENPKEEFYITNKDKIENTTFYRLQGKRGELDVYGEYIIISVDENGYTSGLMGNYNPYATKVSSPKYSVEDAQNIIKEKYGEKTEVHSCKTAIDAVGTSGQAMHICNVITDMDALEVAVGGNTGEILYSNSLFLDASYTYTGEDIQGNLTTITLEEVKRFNETVYRFVNPDQNIVISDSEGFGSDLSGIAISTIFSEHTPIEGNIVDEKFVYKKGTKNDQKTVKTATTAMKNFEDILNAYQRILGRSSYDNKGGKIIVNINVNKQTQLIPGEKVFNAAWVILNNQMYIGEGPDKISLANYKDVLAHEFTHGVIQYTAELGNGKNKNQANEPRALNEAYADILGILITDSDFVLLDDIQDAPIRDLTNPNANNDPKEKGGTYYYPDDYLKDKTLDEFLKEKGYKNLHDYDNGGVHKNATVVGHAAYLMYKNNAFQNKEQMAKVWYQSLFYLSTYSNFEDCALAVIKSAKNLGLSEESITIIKQAFYDTKILEEKYHKIEGTVTDGKNPLRNVKVTASYYLNDEITYTTYTDDNGYYDFKTLPVGSYLITFSKPKYVTITKKYATIDDKDLVYDVTLEIDKDYNEKEMCNPGEKNCYRVSMEFMGYEQETYVKGGTKLNLEKFLKDAYKDDSGTTEIKWDGNNAIIKNSSGITITMTLYYKGTDTEFKANTKITKDTELEYKVSYDFGL